MPSQADRAYFTRSFSGLWGLRQSVLARLAQAGLRLDKRAVDQVEQESNRLRAVQDRESWGHRHCAGCFLTRRYLLVGVR